MSTNSRSDRSRERKESIAAALRIHNNDYVRTEMANNYQTVLDLKAAGKCCQNCAAYVRVRFMGMCKAQRMKLVKEQNICHRWQ